MLLEWDSEEVRERPRQRFVDSEYTLACMSLFAKEQVDEEVKTC